MGLAVPRPHSRAGGFSVPLTAPVLRGFFSQPCAAPANPTRKDMLDPHADTVVLASQIRFTFSADHMNTALSTLEFGGLAETEHIFTSKRAKSKVAAEGAEPRFPVSSSRIHDWMTAGFFTPAPAKARAPGVVGFRSVVPSADGDAETSCEPDVAAGHKDFDGEEAGDHRSEDHRARAVLTGLCP